MLFTVMNLDNWSIFGVLSADFKSKIKSAIVFGDGNEALMIDEDNDIYGVGHNNGSCLGIDSTEGTLEPKKVEALCGKGVKAIVHGSGPHVVALTENGEIYVCGQNKCGELGCEGAGTKTPVLLAPFTEAKIVEIVSGSHHLLARDENGKVYGWGQNNNGQIENAARTSISKPRQISTIVTKVIKSIACTNSASFAVSNNGKVYAWGNKENGQLGVPPDTNITHPFKVPGLENIVIVKLACGYSHVLALSDAGNLIAWGSNNYGQLGIGSKNGSFHAPVRSATDIGRIVDIASTPHGHLSAALTLNGNLYMWGLYSGHIITDPLLTQLKLLSDVFAFFARPSMMLGLLAVKNEDNYSVINSLKLAFDDPADSDLTVIVEEKPIHVHKAILKVQSDYFRRMFSGQWKEHGDGPLMIEQFSYPVYRAYLYYLYTGILDIDHNCVLGLLELSNYYCEKNLKKKCEDVIKNTITPENAVLLYIAGVTYNTKDLEDFCLNYSLNHMSAVIKSEAFSSFDLETMRSFIRKAAQAGAFRS